MLVHRYWKVDDKLFLKNLRDGVRDFQNFVKEINILIDKYSNSTDGLPGAINERN